MTGRHPSALAALAAAPVKTEPFKQPQVEPNQRLLHSFYLHGELALDLYGTLDQHGYEVETATLAGDKTDLCELFDGLQLGQMSRWCDEHLPSARDLLLVSQQDAQVDRAVWEREFDLQATNL